MTRVRSIGNMVKLISGLTERDGLTGWELSFCQSVDRITENGKDTTMLTAKQVEHVERIHDDHFA